MLLSPDGTQKMPEGAPAYRAFLRTSFMENECIAAASIYPRKRLAKG